jgi:hypothetical protein
MNLFPNKGRPFSLWFVASLTLVYLLFEFGFNSRLLDAVGGLTGGDSTKNIEIWGRCLSGFAVALAFYPIFLNLKTDYFTKFFIVSGATLVIVISVFFAEKHLVDSIVDRSSPEQRYAASNLIFFQHMLMTHHAEIGDIAMSNDDWAAPDGKAFMATFPLMMLSIDNINKRIVSQRAKMMRQMANERYGGLNVNFNRYVDSLTQMQNSYNNQYIKACNAIFHAISDTQNQQNKAWKRYINSLAKYRWSPNSVPYRYYGRVGSNVRNAGVPVPSGWEPSDRYAFNVAVANKVKNEATRRYDEGMSREAGVSVPPGLSPDAFFANRAVKTKWLNSLHYPLSVDIRPNIQSAAEFNRVVYSPVLDRTVEDQLKKYDAPVRDFSDGRRLEKFGKDSMRALVAPPLALMFSIAGVMVHLMKIFLMAVQGVTGRAFANGFLKAGFILLFIVLSFWGFDHGLNSKVTDQSLFKDYLVPNAERSFGDEGRIVVEVIRGTIHAQPIAYPLFEAVRKNILLNMKFGLPDKSSNTF